jgi:hypothetical protein
MLNILGYKANANPNDIEISLCSNQNGYLQKHKQKQMLVRVQRKRELLYSAVGI